MSRILFYSEAWGRGGIEAFIRNVSPGLIESGHSIDIMSTWEWGDIEDAALDTLSVRRISAFQGHRPNQIKRLCCGLNLFSEMLKREPYDAVWINTMNGMGFLYARSAHRHGVPIRVVHSHNSDVGEGMKALKRLVGAAGSLLFRKYSTFNVACSKAAGKYLFGAESFMLVPNGIDVDRFRYSEESRKKVRNYLGISDDEILIGNIGRINSQKNPLFQIRVFAEYRKLEPSARYLMLGRPDLRDEVELLALQLGVDKSLTIVPPVDDAAPYYSAMDALLMPSLYEGFGFVKLEAQCASLPVLCSDQMPMEADITDLVSCCSLNDSPTVWAHRLQESVRRCQGFRDPSYADKIANTDYSIEKCCEVVETILNTCSEGTK